MRVVLISLIAVSAAGCGRGGLSSVGVDASGGTTGGTSGATTGASGSMVGAGGSIVDAAGGAAGASLPGIGAGCGKPLPADQPMTIPGKATGYKRYTVLGTGATLAGPVPQKAGPVNFWVRVPADYDPHHAYRVVYIAEGCRAPGAANVDTYQLYVEAQGGSEEAIYVALDPPASMQAFSCYDTAGSSSPEWEAFQLIHTVVDQNYCVDNDQVFASGDSVGGTLASMWGCYFAGDGEHPWNGVPAGGDSLAPRMFAPRYHIRGQASVAGGDPDNEPPCNGPVAALLVSQPAPGTGTQDAPEYMRALARVLKMNGCDAPMSPTSPWHPDVATLAACVKYTACPHAYPVVTCPTDSNKVDHHELAIVAFKRLFDEAGAQP